MVKLYVIECRGMAGLDFTGRQPEQVFGDGAIKGIDTDDMAKIIFRHVPDAVLTGEDVSRWPSLVDPRWVARRRTW
jgi:hypothetical protein